MLLKVIKVVLAALVVNGIYFIYTIVQPLKPEEIHPDSYLRLDEIVTKNGYPFQNHSVRTEDGYILQIHRLPYGKTYENTTNRPAILLAHGLFGDSSVWLKRGPKMSFAYMLADRGYDVWLFNARGTIHSQKHIKLDPEIDEKLFYDFSWNEIGFYDLPATIDYVREATKQDKIIYIGYSQGALSSILLLSQRPDYNKKMWVCVALAPVIYTKNCKSSSFQVTAYYQSFLEWLTDVINFRTFGKFSALRTKLVTRLCKDDSIFQDLCYGVLGTTGGYNGDNFNKSTLSHLLTRFPSVASVKQLFHYTQITKSDIFRQYDYGEINNLVKYGKKTPPEYDWSNVKVPVASFVSDNDWLAEDIDVEKFHSKLPNLVFTYNVPEKTFMHHDFIIGDTAHKVLYPAVIDFLKEYQKVVNK